MPLFYGQVYHPNRSTVRFIRSSAGIMPVFRRSFAGTPPVPTPLIAKMRSFLVMITLTVVTAKTLTVVTAKTLTVVAAKTQTVVAAKTQTVVAAKTLTVVAAKTLTVMTANALTVVAAKTLTVVTAKSLTVGKHEKCTISIKVVYSGRSPPREGWVQGEARWGYWGRSPLF